MELREAKKWTQEKLAAREEGLIFAFKIHGLFLRNRFIQVEDGAGDNRPGGQVSLIELLVAGRFADGK